MRRSDGVGVESAVAGGSPAERYEGDRQVDVHALLRTAGVVGGVSSNFTCVAGLPTVVGVAVS